MAKSKPSNGQLADWGDKYPEEVQSAVRKHEVPRVRIRNGEKFLVLDSTDKIKYEKPAEE